MKILHVTNHFFPCIGGIEQHVLGLSQELTKRGHVSDVLCLNRCSNGKLLPAQGRKGATNIMRVPFVNLKYYKVGKGILKHLEPYDVIHVHGLGYFFDLITATRSLHKKKIILSTHGGFFHTESLGRLKKIHFNTITKHTLKKVDQIVAVSGQDFKRFSQINRNVTYIPNGVDVRGFKKGKKAPNQFVYLGRMAQNKRLDRLIETFRLVTKSETATLYITGNDPEMIKVLKAQAKGMENIVFTGTLQEREKRRLLSRSRYIISASEYEGFGISILEGMAAGCVPIVNAIPSLEGFGTAGLCVDFSNPEKAARAIRRFMHHRVSGKRARGQAKVFDWQRVMKQWERVYG